MLTYERNGKVYSADPNTLPAESLAYLLQYGWAQSLQDSIAGRAKKVLDEYMAHEGHATDDPELQESIDQDLHGTLSKRADSILAGTMGQRESVSRDPFATMCKRVAVEILAGALRANKVTVKRDSEKWTALLAQVSEKHATRIAEEAKRRLESVATLEIDI